MSEEAGKPVPVVLVAMQRENSYEFLLIRRRVKPFIGLWGMPGGKVRDGELPAGAARREILEETGCTARELDLCATVYEEIVEEGAPHASVLIYLFYAWTGDEINSESEEGELAWRSRGDISASPEDMIPTDIRMLNDIIFQKNTGRYSVRVEQNGNGYRLTKFEKVADVF